MSMARVREAMRVHQIAALRGAVIVPAGDGWRIEAAGQEFAVADLAEAERVLLALPLRGT